MGMFYEYHCVVTQASNSVDVL